MAESVVDDQDAAAHRFTRSSPEASRRGQTSPRSRIRTPGVLATEIQPPRSSLDDPERDRRVRAPVPSSDVPIVVKNGTNSLWRCCSPMPPPVSRARRCRRQTPGRRRPGRSGAVAFLPREVESRCDPPAGVAWIAFTMGEIRPTPAAAELRPTSTTASASRATISSRTPRLLGELAHDKCSVLPAPEPRVRRRPSAATRG
jgi:hypothetical protein